MNSAKRSQSPSRRAQQIPLMALAVLALALVGHLGRTLESERTKDSILTYTDLRDENAAPVAALLGELRANLSYLLFMKTEQYLHSGVRYRPLTEREIKLGREKIHHDFETPQAEHVAYQQPKEEIPDEGVANGSAGRPPGRGHSHGAQLVPPPEWDRRGIFGDLDRAVHPYEKEGEIEHGDAQELLPWYRLATYMNPRFPKAYVIGAFAIASYGGKVDEAEAFLREGLQMNPESMEVNESLGRFLLHRRERPGEAKPLFMKAVELGKKKEKLSDDERHALRSAYSNLALLEWKSNQAPSAAREIAREGLERFPEYRALERIIRDIDSPGSQEKSP